jgi:hypothetical protein
MLNNDSSATTPSLCYGISGQFSINQQFGILLQYEGLGRDKADSTVTGSDLNPFLLCVIYNFQASKLIIHL